jgi:ABC-type molybdenum transport system ATPase subunit/photorepair protein PhrA
MSSINLNKMRVRANYLNRSAKQAFYTARKRSGDINRIAEMTGYSTSHISNIISGRRNINDTIADAMYKISSRRMKNSEKPEMADYDLEFVMSW